ncbi:helix-turn-helix domain-containing protein [Pyrobaculum neutrophilum]|uniref:HTH arsR-type domain-containing protein n=1 Tax=Pyrobaculum neutrophilum (strain DSM 2338 / JCM 9278 / NBRC 100436 / V24Sta) TaxID=444157 RepID=B1YDU8_PYRNV|nr:helix-turn-helix domain-containing protein [Pyrobaculum neutrophilum]ACB39961.1 conserved hypothetical protein [Pyrobaculum neutrophilum V24Sta]
MRYLLAAIAVAAFAASLSIAFPRLAPLVLRISAIALLAIAALWLIEYIAARPPPLAQRILKTLRARGPLTAGELARELNADPTEVAEALQYLLEKGLVRRYRVGEEEYFE